MLVTYKKRSYKDITECLICKKPLGYDSRESGLVFCHDHIKCIRCSEPITGPEAQNCYDRFLESLDAEEGETEESVSHDLVQVIHARCLILEKEPITELKQSEVDFLNNLRLMVMPDMKLGVVTNENNAEIYSGKVIADMTIDQKRMHLCMIEACAAAVKNAIRQSPEYRKEDDRKIEKERFNVPRVAPSANTHTSRAANNSTSTVSSQPPTLSQIAKEQKEAALLKFMSDYSLTDRAAAKVMFSDLLKAVKGMVSTGWPEAIALEMHTKALIDAGRLTPKKAE